MYQYVCVYIRCVVFCWLLAIGYVYLYVCICLYVYMLMGLCCLLFIVSCLCKDLGRDDNVSHQEIGRVAV